MTIDPQWAILGKFVVALVLGGIIGWEREISDKPAGLRTHMIVVGAACLLICMTGLVGGAVKPGMDDEGFFRTDPLRIVQGIIIGISFLGAGTIIRRGGGEKVEGLTTAASIWLASVIGIYVGLAQYIVAIAVTLITVFVLHWLDRTIEKVRRQKVEDRG